MYLSHGSSCYSTFFFPEKKNGYYQDKGLFSYWWWVFDNWLDHLDFCLSTILSLSLKHSIILSSCIRTEFFLSCLDFRKRGKIMYWHCRLSRLSLSNVSIIRIIVGEFNLIHKQFVFGTSCSVVKVYLFLPPLHITHTKSRVQT